MQESYNNPRKVKRNFENIEKLNLEKIKLKERLDNLRRSVEGLQKSLDAQEQERLKEQSEIIEEQDIYKNIQVKLVSTSNISGHLHDSYEDLEYSFLYTANFNISSYDLDKTFFKTTVKLTDDFEAEPHRFFYGTNGLQNYREIIINNTLKFRLVLYRSTNSPIVVRLWAINMINNTIF